MQGEVCHRRTHRLDRDGVDDRQQLHDLVSDSGAVLNHEVLDATESNRYLDYPQKSVEWSDGDPILDSNTKYLIVADIRSCSGRPDDERDRRTQIGSQLTAMWPKPETWNRRDQSQRLLCRTPVTVPSGVCTCQG